MFLALIAIAFLLHYFIFKPRTDDRSLAALLAALMLTNSYQNSRCIAPIRSAISWMTSRRASI
jgi:hypothetical protein